MLTDDETTFRVHAAELTRYAAAIGGPSDADDVVADAFASAFASPKWATVEDRRAYLHRAVLNEVRDRHRSRSRRRRRELAARERTDKAELEVRLEVLAVMNSLTTRQRAVLFCLYWLDLDAADTAQRLDLSIRTVQRDSQTARRHMKALLR
jgi:RNA polymerase sigma factor (sigma-70 family)